MTEKEEPMLFDVEKEAALRCTIEEHEVCAGCPYLGLVKDEERFCIMGQAPQTCIVAKACGRFGTSTS